MLSILEGTNLLRQARTAGRSRIFSFGIHDSNPHLRTLNLSLTTVVCRNPHVDLVPLSDNGKLRLDKRLTIVGAHGEEIVRDLYGDFASETVFTAGEDGAVRAFRAV